MDTQLTAQIILIVYLSLEVGSYCADGVKTPTGNKGTPFYCYLIVYVLLAVILWFAGAFSRIGG